MLKFLFWSLLCVNGALLAYGQGVLGHVKGSEREPARMNAQLNVDKIHLISPAMAKAAAADAASSAKVALAKQKVSACTEVGNFAAADAKRFEAQLEVLDLGDRQSRHNVAVQEVTSHIVFIPSLGSKEAADKKAEELKQLGVTNYFIMSDDTPMRWSISLGVFKSDAAAQTLLAQLIKQGVHSARVAGRGTASKQQLVYQFRELDADTKARLEQIKASFPAQDLRACN